MATRDEVVAVLTGDLGLTLKEEKPIQGGIQIVTAEGPILNVYNSGKMVPGGKNRHLIESFEARLDGSGSGNGCRKVFVVYGRDLSTRNDLEALLRRWRLEPILLDQLTSQGDTLIEKLERSMRDAAFAVVLATPDDEGHIASRPDETKFRARQNVVLELGMMLRGLGRKKVAILLPQLERGVMERPSDIDGLIYIPYTDSIDDAKVTLAKEMNKQGLKIDLESL